MKKQQTRPIAKNSLRQRAFSVQRITGEPALDDIYDLVEDIKFKEVHDCLFTLKDWILIPYSEWQTDFAGIARHVCAQIKRGKKLGPAFDLFMDLVKDMPGASQQEAVDHYEHCARAGVYDPLVRDHAKYRERHHDLLMNLQFHAELKRLDEIFDLKSRQNSKGIIRRILCLERGMRSPEFDFDPKKKDAWFNVVFSCFCWKWDLYGLENMMPLLMKVTVNLTPYGLMIFLPKWMSFDLKRDLLLKAIAKLHKSRGVERQGPKLSAAKLEFDRLSLRVVMAEQQAAARKRTGEDRLQYIYEQVGLPEWTNARRFRKLKRRGLEILKGKHMTKPKAPRAIKKTEDPSADAKAARIRASILDLPKDKEKELLEWLNARQAGR